MKLAYINKKNSHALIKEHKRLTEEKMRMADKIRNINVI